MGARHCSPSAVLDTVLRWVDQRIPKPEWQFDGIPLWGIVRQGHRASQGKGKDPESVSQKLFVKPAAHLSGGFYSI